MPPIINIDKKLLHDLYRNAELSTKKISQILDYSQTCIYNNLLRRKIPIITNSQRYKGKPGRPHTETARRKISIAKNGWCVIRVWGSEIKEDISNCVDRVEKFLK